MKKEKSVVNIGLILIRWMGTQLQINANIAQCLLDLLIGNNAPYCISQMCYCSDTKMANNHLIIVFIQLLLTWLFRDYMYCKCLKCNLYLQSFPMVIVFVLVLFAHSKLSDVQPVSTGLVSGSHTGSQGSEDHQLQYLLEERPCLLCHFASLPTRKDVRNSWN